MPTHTTRTATSLQSSSHPGRRARRRELLRAPRTLPGLMLVLGCLAPLGAAAQQQIPGRFVVAIDQGTAVLVDSSTGESWVYTVGSDGWQGIDFPLPDGRRQRLPPTDRAYQR